MLLEDLTRLAGVSGFEDEVRNFIREKCKDLADEVMTDRLGNVIAIKKGTTMPDKVVSVIAHMDEIGFIISHIMDSGLLKFAPIGGIDVRTMVSKRLLIGKDKIPGVIGAKAIHLQKRGEWKTPLGVNQLFIDIGASDKKEAEALVSVGDTAVYNSEPIYFGNNLYKCRALDDRVGCALLLKALEGRYPVTLAAVFSVQEEMGLRGSKVAVHRIKPDAGICLEGTTCADMHDVPEHAKVTVIGKGPAITHMERSTIAHRGLLKFVEKIGNINDIPWQYRIGNSGGTDAASLQMARDSKPVVHITVPCRYIHSPVSVCSLDDFENAGKLLNSTLEKFDKFFNKEAEV